MKYLSRFVAIATYIIITFLPLSNCIAKEQIKPHSQKISVVVSILPLANFVKNIGRNNVEVSVMIPPGASPHTYEPTPSQLKKISNAQLYIKVGSGIEFERIWMNKLIKINKNMMVCDSSAGISLRKMSCRIHKQNIKKTNKKRTGSKNKQSSCIEHNDPHIWLSPVNAEIMAQNIRDALIKVDPENKDFYLKNAEKFISKLKHLDTQLKQILSKMKNKSFIVIHPAWGYFADHYGLKQVPVKIEGKEPTAKELINIIQTAKKQNIKAVFASPQFSPKSARTIAENIKGKVIIINPLGENYIDNLYQTANILASTEK